MIRRSLLRFMCAWKESDTMTKKLEEYIETIYELQREAEEDHVHTNEIAKRLGIRAASVTEMVQKLSKMELVNYIAYYGVSLTLRGQEMAKKLMEMHKTLAEFLEIIGVNSKDAEIDACQIEHHVSPQTMKQLNKFVEFVHTSPRDPKWLEHFEHFCQTGERLRCEKVC